MKGVLDSKTVGNILFKGFTTISDVKYAAVIFQAIVSHILVLTLQHKFLGWSKNIHL